MASILDIKFSNEVIQILIENAEAIFPSPESSPELGGRWTRLDLLASTPEEGDNPDGREAKERPADSEANHVTSSPSSHPPPSASCGRKKASHALRSTVNGLSPVEESCSDIAVVERSVTTSGAPSGENLNQSTRSGVLVSSGESSKAFSSGFSDLSVNSLPDMSLLLRNAASSSSERPRSKSHQHDSPPRVLTLKSPALQQQLSQAAIQVNPGVVGLKGCSLTGGNVRTYRFSFMYECIFLLLLIVPFLLTKQKTSENPDL